MVRVTKWIISALKDNKPLNYMGVTEFLGVGYDYDEKYTDKIRVVTKEKVKEIAQRYLNAQNYGLAVVGGKD